ncbi:MAG: alpha/beta hydrolase [Pseudomonadota bacterium]
MIDTDVRHRNSVSVVGTGKKTLVLAHGFGCDQTMWRLLTPHFQDQFRIVLFDYVGSGKSDPRAFRGKKYSELKGYAEDIIDVCEALDLEDAILVGHSVSSMTGLIAAIEVPRLISKLVMVCPSPFFLNDPPHYHGGFERADLEGLIELMDQNYIGWANHLAPLVMGTSGEGLTEELVDSFCSTDPLFAKTFAKATFFSDCRHLLDKATQPTLILQSTHDALASVSVGEYVHANMAHSKLEVVEANGHCLHMTHPREIAPSVINFASA